MSDVRILHAYHNPFRVFQLDGLTMLVGDDGRGVQLEVGIVSGGGTDLVVHAMRARAGFLRR